MVPSTTSNLISFETIEKRSLKNSPHFPCSCRHNASQNYIYRYMLARVVFFIIFPTENGLRQVTWKRTSNGSTSNQKGQSHMKPFMKQKKTDK